MLKSRRTRIVLFVASALLIGLGIIFFARQNLDVADKVASVASFFVGFVSLALATWSFLTDRAARPNQAGSAAADSLPGGNITISGDTGVLQIGGKNKAVVKGEVNRGTTPA